jgi:uncharacterized membrane protein YhhN
MNNKTLFKALYLILAIIEIVAETFEITYLVYVTKPLLVLSLLNYCLRKSNVTRSSQKMLFLVALCFALSGDIFLMIRGVDLFIPGLASFLAMQWFYIFVFRKQIPNITFTTRQLLLFLPFLGYAAAFFLTIYPGISESVIRVAVGIYAISISTMAWLALLRKDAVTRRSFLFVFAGALLFVVSDSLIAIGRFVKPIPFDAILIMGTYAAAQFLITMGITETVRDD